MLDGKFTSFKLVQLLKALPFSIFKLDGSSIFLRLKQSEKAALSILLILPKNTTLSRLEHLVKAFSEISVTPRGIVINFNFNEMIKK